MLFSNPFQVQKITICSIIYFAVYFAIIFLFSSYSQAYIYAEDDDIVVRTAPTDDLPPLQKSLFWILENRPASKFGFSGLSNDPEQLDIMLINLYLENGISPYWVTEYGPGRRAFALISLLSKAEGDGLESLRYRIDDIYQLLHSKETENLARLDIMLTLAMCIYITDMREGRAASCLLDPKLFAAARDNEVDLQKVIQDGLNARNLVYFLEMQAPQHADYQSLKKLLAEYRQLEKQGGWPKIPEGRSIKPGMEDERLDLLADRLFITGDLQVSPDIFLPAAPIHLFLADPMPPAISPRIYDEALVKAVKRFQYRYNLDQDGVVGKDTLAALNIPVRDHINKIILNMERWRWLPRQLDGRRILVNIAGFDLAGVNNEETEITMPVIVGKLHNKTPVFSHTMSYIEINPYWTIPPSIARNEIVEKMQNEPKYLQRQGIRLFSGWERDAAELDPAVIDWHTIGDQIKRYRLRQEPGSSNALGRIKFMFPNSLNIYMHDTPSRGLFRRTKRFFSHGCIRVGQPVDLALYILKNDGLEISRRQLKRQIASGKQKIFVLEEPLPVHIFYRTVRVDPENGTAHFYDDIYDRDALLSQALFPENGKAIQCRYSYK